MRARTHLVLLLILLSGLPPLAHATPSPVSSEGPDADGTYRLAYDIVRERAGRVALALDVLRDDAGDQARATRDLGVADLPGGTTRWNTGFLPIEGHGRYHVALVVDGVAGEPLVFDVHDGDGGAAPMTFHVPDAPTRLALTRDAVNADGKLKSPGEEVVTRATVADDNGLDDLDGVLARVERRDGTRWRLVDVAWADWSPVNATAAAVEHRFARAPLAATEHRIVLAARKGGADVADVSRTFVVRETATVVEARALPDVVPDEDRVVASALTFSDRNGVPPEGNVTLRTYRGSARVEQAGVLARFASGGMTATLGEATPLPDANGTARSTLPFALHVGRNATPGAYRVSVYLDGALAGSAPFQVHALPRLEDVSVAVSADRVWLNASGAGVGRVFATLVAQDGSRAGAQAAFTDGRGPLEIAAPGDGWSWNVTLRAREDGPSLAWREGTSHDTARLLPLRVLPQRVAPSLPAVWRLEAAGADVADATADIRLTRWDGEDAPGLVASWTDGRVRVDGPARIEPGRYHVHAQLAWPDGARANASWSFEAGPWLRLRVGNASVTDRTAELPLLNDGGVAIRRLVVEVDGPPAVRGSAKLEVTTPGQRVAFAARGERHVATGLVLAPGEDAKLHVRLPDGPLPAGALTVHVRILALAGGDP